jgi:hypothetical protein
MWIVTSPFCSTVKIQIRCVYFDVQIENKVTEHDSKIYTCAYEICLHYPGISVEKLILTASYIHPPVHTTINGLINSTKHFAEENRNQITERTVNAICPHASCKISYKRNGS